MTSEKDRVLVIYHRADLDGQCSAALAKLKFPEATLWGINHGEEIPWMQIDAADHVVLLDFSFKDEDMQRITLLDKHFTWIDHHITSIEWAEKWADETASEALLRNDQVFVLSETHAACELAYMHWWGKGRPLRRETPDRPLRRETPDTSDRDFEGIAPGAKVKKACYPVYLLGRYDVWDLEADPNILPFQMGMRTQNLDPANYPESMEIWKSLFTGLAGHLEKDFIQQGQVVLNYQKQMNERLMKNAFEIDWRGERFLAVNGTEINSKAFETRFDPNIHDAVMAFHWDGETEIWRFSLYSPNQSVDLSPLAVDMGGGGHMYACGFQTKNLEFLGENL